VLEACEFLVDGHRAFFGVVYFVDIITSGIAVIFFAVLCALRIYCVLNLMLHYLFCFP
jgi:hypothetical protein